MLSFCVTVVGFEKLVDQIKNISTIKLIRTTVTEPEIVINLNLANSQNSLIVTPAYLLVTYPSAQSITYKIGKIAIGMNKNSIQKEIFILQDLCAWL